MSSRCGKLLLALPLVNLDISQNNFIFKSISVWNKLISVIFEKCLPRKDGLMIPGSSINSDMSASIGVVKNKLKQHLLHVQSAGDQINWSVDQLQLH